MHRHGTRRRATAIQGLLTRLADRRRLRIFGRRCRFHRDHRHVINVHFGILGFLFLTLFFLPRPQLLAAFLEILRALCLRGGVDPRSETFDGDACIHAVRIRARDGRIAVALHEHTIEQNAILHQIRHGHRGNATRTAAAKHSHGGQAPADDG